MKNVRSITFGKAHFNKVSFYIKAKKYARNKTKPHSTVIAKRTKSHIPKPNACHAWCDGVGNKS